MTGIQIKVWSHLDRIYATDGFNTVEIPCDPATIHLGPVRRAAITTLMELLDAAMRVDNDPLTRKKKFKVFPNERKG